MASLQSLGFSFNKLEQIIYKKYLWYNYNIMKNLNNSGCLLQFQLPPKQDIGSEPFLFIDSIVFQLNVFFIYFQNVSQLNILHKCYNFSFCFLNNKQL
jgi:hypothetical protein